MLVTLESNTDAFNDVRANCLCATVICHASLRLAGPEDKHGVENAGEKIFRPILLLWIIGDPYFFNHESLTHSTR